MNFSFWPFLWFGLPGRLLGDSWDNGTHNLALLPQSLDGHLWRQGTCKALWTLPTHGTARTRWPKLHCRLLWRQSWHFMLLYDVYDLLCDRATDVVMLAAIGRSLRFPKPISINPTPVTCHNTWHWAATFGKLNYRSSLFLQCRRHFSPKAVLQHARKTAFQHWKRCVAPEVACFCHFRPPHL